ncbi:CAP domain-containing protein [Lactobacillus sp. CC-MHH1034]|uniref:CAP domain-containing protein n=1 Tax=Agrilactobacillus fermenti TaxID=2586909 RepID=UPI001E37F491|nr:CAP domain-containing protein [Agrilactobacillus fermenti]MCD2256527.1 CAP domain-containing protein [Agrilactobacillus fermenti]
MRKWQATFLLTTSLGALSHSLQAKPKPIQAAEAAQQYSHTPIFRKRALQVAYQPNFDHVRALMVHGINDLRAQNGLQPLRYNQNITDAWSQTIVDRNMRNGKVAHEIGDQRQAMHQIGYYFFGENLAMTPIDVPIKSGDRILPAVTSDQQLAIALITQYYDDIGVADFGHRKNLLNPYFDQIGLALNYRTDADGTVRVYNSLNFAGVATNENNQAINDYLAYSTTIGLDQQRFPSTYTPLDEQTISRQANLIGVVPRNQNIHLYNRYGQQATHSGRQLPGGSTWRITETCYDETGQLWYQVGADQWVNSNSIQVQCW